LGCERLGVQLGDVCGHRGTMPPTPLRGNGHDVSADIGVARFGVSFLR